MDLSPLDVVALGEFCEVTVVLAQPGVAAIGPVAFGVGLHRRDPQAILRKERDRGIDVAGVEGVRSVQR